MRALGAVGAVSVVGAGGAVVVLFLEERQAVGMEACGRWGRWV